MNISLYKLLGKIEEELNKAKQTDNEARIRERIHAVKALCELVLEEQTDEEQRVKKAPSITPTPSVSVNQSSQKLDVNKEANGDSLFDF